MDKKIIVLFHNDLRIDDHPALWHAAKVGTVIPVFIHNSSQNNNLSAKDYWTYYSLQNLQKKLSDAGVPLILRKGDILVEIIQLLEETHAHAIYFNERFSQDERYQDEQLIHLLKEKNIEVKRFYGDTLFSLTTITNKQNKPYAIFTSFYKRCLQETVRRPLGIPSFKTSSISIQSLLLEDLQLLVGNWYKKFNNYWTPGEDGAHGQLEYFIERGLHHYGTKRDFPATVAVSRLSPYLAAGNISIRTLWAIMMGQLEDEEDVAIHQQIESFLRQLIWREFSYYQLEHQPIFTTQPLRSGFLQFQWEQDTIALEAWKKGKTGYPLVDAGMRELWATGYIHNRVRMVVASFLVKHLLQPWQTGYAWFEYTLVDFNAANNAMGWQWVAGTGIDAAPYFRIFNPTLQGEKFDVDGDYIKKWVPELKHLPPKYIHSPHTAPRAILEQAKIQLGSTYPLPIVDHQAARARALERYQAIKKA